MLEASCVGWGSETERAMQNQDSHGGAITCSVYTAAAPQLSTMLS